MSEKRLSTAQRKAAGKIAEAVMGTLAAMSEKELRAASQGFALAGIGNVWWAIYALRSDMVPLIAYEVQHRQSETAKARGDAS